MVSWIDQLDSWMDEFIIFSQFIYLKIEPQFVYCRRFRAQKIGLLCLKILHFVAFFLGGQTILDDTNKSGKGRERTLAHANRSYYWPRIASI